MAKTTQPDFPDYLNGRAEIGRPSFETGFRRARALLRRIQKENHQRDTAISKACDMAELWSIVLVSHILGNDRLLKQTRAKESWDVYPQSLSERRADFVKEVVSLPRSIGHHEDMTERFIALPTQPLAQAWGYTVRNLQECGAEIGPINQAVADLLPELLGPQKTIDSEYIRWISKPRTLNL